MDAFVHSMLTDLGIAIRLYAYSNMLPNRMTGGLMTTRAPWWERVCVSVFYPLQKAAMRKVLNITPESTEQARTEILASFEAISKRVGPGGFLFGDRLTAADLVFAASTAPITLPPEYGTPFPALSDSPPPMQATVLAVRETRAGQHALRVYREYRRPRYNAANTSATVGVTWRQRLSRWFQRALSSPFLLRVASKILRLKPVLRLGQTTVVSGYEQVVKTLTADQDFTIAEINAARMNRISGPFLLGMDRGAQYDRENAAVHSIIKLDRSGLGAADCERDGGVDGGCGEALRAAGCFGNYARVSAARVVAEYLGVPGPTEHILMQWMRSLFWDVFFEPEE